MPDITVGGSRIEVGMQVTTHPIQYKGLPRVPSQRGVVKKHSRVPGMWKVQIGGELLSFWDFELEPVLS